MVTCVRPQEKNEKKIIELEPAINRILLSLDETFRVHATMFSETIDAAHAKD